MEAQSPRNSSDYFGNWRESKVCALNDGERRSAREGKAADLAMKAPHPWPFEPPSLFCGYGSPSPHLPHGSGKVLFSRHVLRPYQATIKEEVYTGVNVQRIC